jgi:Ca2+-binding EF-hand superfamily protein
MYAIDVILRRAAAVTVTSCLLLLAPRASAYEEMPTGGPPAQYTQFLKMKAMQVMDSGKKGTVTKEEFMKFHEEMFDRMDKNHDGKLSPEEWLGHAPKKSDG